MSYFGTKPPQPKIGKSQGTSVSPGTQKTTGVRPQPAKVVKGPALAQGYTGAQRIKRASANKKGKEVVPRAAITAGGRAKPVAEY